MSSNRRDLLAANLDFQYLFELKQSGALVPVVPPEQGAPVAPGAPRSNAIGRDQTAPVKGIRCLSCNCAHHFVLETRQVAGGRIMRRRQCRHCGRKVTTVERPYGK
jgi:hypothetical protein